MQWHCLSMSSSTLTLPILPSLSSFRKPIFHLSSHSSIINLRLSLNYQHLMPINKIRRRRTSMKVYNSYISPHNLPWISAVSTAILMLVKGTAINRSFLVPLFALQAPASVISWMQEEYGAWSAFLALLVRLFFSIPGELELPFLTLVLVIVAPHQHYT